MPTYEYACRSCGQHLEVVQSFSDAPLAECPHCGGDLRKVFGSIGISFKGSGFYKTDSRSSSGASRSAEPSSGGGSTESPSTAAKSESTPSAAKSDSASTTPKPSGPSVGAAAS